MEQDDILRLEDFLPYRLNRLADVVSRDFSAIYKSRYGITRPEWRLIATLGQYGSMTATEIGRHSAMHKTKVSRAVSALEKRRWVSRTPDETDRRVEHLALTRAGSQAYREMVPIAKEYDRRLSKAMNPARLAEFYSGLDRLEEIILGERQESG